MKVVARKTVRLKRSPGSQLAQAAPIAQPLGLFGMGAPQGGVGLMAPQGGLMNRPVPKPTHSVAYTPGMKNDPKVRKVRADVRAGRGPRRVDFTKHHSKNRGG